jgi:hypothetical protein
VSTTAGARSSNWSATRRSNSSRRGRPPIVAATHLVGGIAGPPARLVGLALATVGVAVVVDPSTLRVRLRDTWVDRVGVPPTTVVLAPSGHPWLGGASVRVAGDDEVLAAAAAATVDVARPVVEACRRFTRVGAAGLWNEVADRLGLATAHQPALRPDSAGHRRLRGALEAPGVPWRARPTLAIREMSVGPVTVGRRGGCCLTDLLGTIDERDALRCSTCSRRAEDDCHRRQLEYMERLVAGAGSLP